MAAKPNPVPGYPPGYHDIASLSIPSGLELLSAHWYYRHAERTPVRPRLAHLGIPSQWNLCAAGREFATAVLNDSDSSLVRKIDGKKQDTELMLIRTRMEIPTTKSRYRQGGPAECFYGQLTDVGRQSTLRLGQQLRALYVDKLAFLPGKLTAQDADMIYFRSTGVPRAFESLQQAIHGLFPAHDPSYVPVLLQRGPHDETLYPNPMACPTLRLLDRANVKRVAEKYNETLLAPLDSKIAKVVGTPVRIDSHPSANGVLDTVRACIAHDIPVPNELADKEVQETLEKAIVHEWFDGFASKQHTRLAMGRLFGDLRQRLQTRIDDPTNDKLKLALYAAHDTTIAPILKVLDVYDERWPDFTAYVSFELFGKAKDEDAKDGPAHSGLLSRLNLSSAKPADPKDYFVRVRYNSKDMKVPACQPKGMHLEGSDGTVCTFEAFKNAVKDVAISSEDWMKACKEPVEDTA